MNYLKINKEIVAKNLSTKALGIYLIVKVLNDNNEKITLESIKSLTLDGMTSIRSGLNELIDKGIIIREPKRGAKGGFNGYEYKMTI